MASLNIADTLRFCESPVCTGSVFAQKERARETFPLRVQKKREDNIPTTHPSFKLYKSR